MNRQVRYPLVKINPFTINHMHLRNPWMMAWMAACFPGYGHLILCKYFEGYLFIIWEFFINYKIKLNTAIFLSMTGNFQEAQNLINTNWFLLYITVYVFQIWHCMRLTFQLNKFTILARREKAPYKNYSMNWSEINYLYRRNPKHAVYWSAFTPGLGHLYLNHLPTGIFEFIWFVITVYYSNLLPAVNLTMQGNFAEATAVLDPQWLLFIPSVFVYNLYSTYVNGKEYNKYFDVELSRYFEKNYQSHKFQMPNRTPLKVGKD
ncbi:hypothetical protein [Aquibacillus rhizosphaerae]|uniref:Uncharacterized protein n=1 Tax=Aquibacillus rhizosphaerae TaxID=3051431 RepID=A0ABT7L288_9BACI|nr:hypothetical protein [Aquibacillus sp. LR5S19]MDL4839970.1 hypothetical protein [Aquibacillus sp. LR5S19]